MDDLLEKEHREGHEEGREEGLAEGRELQAFNTTKHLYNLGLSSDQIAAAVGFDTAIILKWLTSVNP